MERNASMMVLVHCSPYRGSGCGKGYEEEKEEEEEKKEEDAK